MKKGFSILETLVATAIIVALAAVIFQLLTGGRMFYGIGQARMQAQEQARLALFKMVRELNEATSAYAYIRNFPPQGPTRYKAKFDAATGTYKGNGILFKIPCRDQLSGGGDIVRLNNNGKVVFGARDANSDYQDYLYIDYYFDDEQRQLLRRVYHQNNIDLDPSQQQTFLRITAQGNPEVSAIIASNISNASFCALVGNNPRQIEITVTGRGWDSSRRQEVSSSATSEVFFRN